MFIEIYSTFGSVALITLIINGKGQRIGDLAAKTTIIKLQTKTSLKETIFTHIDENYKPRFPQADMLDDNTIATIKELLNLKIEHDRYDVKKRDLISKTSIKIKGRLNIQNELPPKVFLEAIVKDYNFLKGN